MQIRKFFAYDLEWYPSTYRVRLVGTHDGIRYRAFKDIKNFFLDLVVYQSSGTVFFAHAGGLADVQFVLEYLSKIRSNDLTISAVFSGSSAIIVKVEFKGRHWYFADSLWLLKSSLAKIAESMGSKKLDDWHCTGECAHPKEHKCVFYAPDDVLRDYNERDCEILWTAIARFKHELEQLGGELRFTVASCAMRLFTNRFLSSEIRPNKVINDILRQSYFASRVEVIRPKCQKANYYDINSSFPNSMCAKMPGNLIDIRGDIPKSNPYFAKVRVRIPDLYLPPLAIRRKGRIFYPTGEWSTILSDTDIEAVENDGGEILSVDDVYEFEPFYDLREYAQTIYGMRQNEKDDFRRTLLKYLLNGLYGKFAEKRTKSKILFDPPFTSCPHDGAHVMNGISTCMTQINSGVWRLDEEIDIDHEHVAISSRITALSRQALGFYGKTALAQGANVYYFDTDSITTEATLPTGPELGRLKKEYEVIEGKFAAPKLYAIKTTKGDVVKAKGFRGLQRDEFNRLCDNHESVDIIRMLRIRELLHTDDMAPREKSSPKRLSLKITPKRCYIGNNDTRPWTIQEIDSW